MFTIEQTIPWGELEEVVRETTLLHPRDGEMVYPYADADIQLTEISYSEVAPTSLYVLRQNLALQAEIASDLSVEGFHPLELSGGLVLKDESGRETGFVPPVVEETAADGRYVLDGAHRTSIGRWLGRKSFMAIYVSGIRSDCLSYAIPNSWDELRIMDAVPPDPNQKKHYRDNYRSLYRDFSRLNGSRLREA